jgi:hypothetical protein
LIYFQKFKSDDRKEREELPQKFAKKIERSAAEIHRDEAPEDHFPVASSRVWMPEVHARLLILLALDLGT